MSAPDAVYWASASLMWAVTILAYLMMRHWRLRLQTATVQLQETNASLTAQMVDRPALEKWARWTMFTVTDRNGMIEACTIMDLFRDNFTERVWTDPIAVTMWQADSTTHAAWQEEAERLMPGPQGGTGE